MINPIYVSAKTIEDAWFQCISNILDYGFEYEIQQGSFVGQTRLEFDWITVLIEYPYAEPYDMMLPEIPEHYNIPNPVEKGYVEQYLPYLMTAEKQEDEDYTYGERLSGYEWLSTYQHLSVYRKIQEAIGEGVQPPTEFNFIDQIQHFIDFLKNTPNTNQAVLQVAQPSDCLLDDPPCLRHIDMRIKDNKLIFYPYFRSWDLWGGFPANLAGIAVLQKYMADCIGVKSGEIIVSSKGLHIYRYVEELAKIRTNKI